MGNSTTPNAENENCPPGTYGMNCWISTGDVSPGLWIGIALGIPVAVLLFILHRKEKFSCWCKYNPIGLEDRLKWLITFALAIFFYIKMFLGPAYFTTIFEKEETPSAFHNQRYHAICAILTLTMRLILSITQILACTKNGNWKTTKPFGEIYN